MRTLLGWLGIAFVGVGFLQPAKPQLSIPAPLVASHSSSSPASQYRALLDRYCVTCHNEKLKTAELVLSTADVENVSDGAIVWEKVARKLRTGVMPPAGMPRPDKAGYDSFATYLEMELDRTAAANPNPGRTAVHRLNRTEYGNAIRDLLALDIDVESLLPADESTNGFDNNSDVLSVSPLLMERYMSAARRISRLAVGDTAARLAFETYNMPKIGFLKQEDRMSGDLPFGSRGGIAIRHYFPLDGEYVLKIRLQRNERDYIIGLGEPHQLDVRLDGARLKLFTVGGEIHGKSGAIYSNATEGERAQEDYEHEADAGLEVRFPARTGMRLVGVAFLDESRGPEGALQRPLTQFDLVQYKGGKPAVDSVTIGGPYDAKGLGETPSSRKIFVCRPSGSEDEEPCAEKIFSTLARRAYRGVVGDRDVQILMSLYRAGRSKGGFEAGIEMALRKMLVSPKFMFHIERDPAKVAPGSVYRISNLELASRLSFFLWSSIPDDPLLDLAERGKLKDPEVLGKQVRRMLADPRSKALVAHFAGQWLNLRTLSRVSPDPEAFTDFDENLRDAFRQETELFFESMLREDRSVLDLLNADYTFLNERLAGHYGIPNVYGSHFRRVTLSDEKRRGLIGQGSVLTVTSYATRTSPTLRGKWVLENILGAPPPPPPGNVPSLQDRDKDGRIRSVREQMEQHRKNPACASCHARMDPIGFALENFDAIGKWRTVSGADNTPVDSSGVLPDGARFQGPAELRRLLLSRPQEFATAATEKLLTYALRRGVRYEDAPVVRKIVREAGPSEYRWSSLIVGVANSMPFQMRRSPEP
ncbi:MAG: DUF1592 domain-containing protein [Acidobacteria bacterium]|nr:DUF1592 domain-containing protein [Acidobacteriota bacterium]